MNKSQLYNYVKTYLPELLIKADHRSAYITNTKEYLNSVYERSIRVQDDIADLSDNNTGIVIESPSYIDLINIIKSAARRPFNVVLRSDNDYYALNDRTTRKLLKTLREVEMLEYIPPDNETSDFKLMKSIINNGNIEVLRVLDDESVHGLIEEIAAKGFDYISKLKIDLSRYQIAKTKKEYLSYEFSEINCFVYALRMFGIEEKICMDIQHGLGGESFLPRRKLKDICEKYELHIKVKTESPNKKAYRQTFEYGDLTKPLINIGLIDKHYFLIERTNFNKKQLESNDFINYKNKTKNITSYSLMKYLVADKEKYLIPMTDSKKDMNDVFDHHLDNLKTLNYNKKNIGKNEYRIKEDDNFVNIFFDTETTTDGDIHIVYLCKVADCDIDFTGEDCCLKMLLYFSKKYNKIRLIAHNLRYDHTFLLKYLTNFHSIQRGVKILHGNGIFMNGNKKIQIQVQDSLSLIPKPLRDFGECFKLDCEKEYMPYKMYTNENIKKNFIPLDEFKEYESYDEFTNNCKRWKCLNNKNEVNLLKYSSKYCAMDCEVLKKGYECFKKSIFEITTNKINEIKQKIDIESAKGLNINKYISTASIAHDYCLKSGVYDGVKSLNGIPREFIQKGVVGGRVMCRKNKKKHIYKYNQQDFDAVSLYPSAMMRLGELLSSNGFGGLLLGSPKELKEGQLNYEFLKKQDGYFIEIVINKVNKHYKFPLFSIKNEKTNVRNFRNDIEGQRVHIDKIALEDLIKYQRIEFDVIRGYYYDEGRNPKISEVIQHLYNTREIEKINKNPIQEVYKLVMNAIYGKSLLKPFDTEVVYLPVEKAKKYIHKHFNHIFSINRLSDKKTIMIKEYTMIDDHYNNCHCGIEILSMSKRIMNEVMCLAEDLGIQINYQDTDSMHINAEKIEILQKEYFKIYGRELIGKSMGQFHCDFSSKIIKSDIKSVESYFLGKKCYIDKLEGYDTIDPKDPKRKIVTDYHMRMKGVSDASIKYYSKINNISLMDIYRKLFEGETLIFDLTCGGDKMCVEFLSNYEMRSKKDFPRTLKF